MMRGRFTVKRASSLFRTIREPYAVVDRLTFSIVDEYHSRRAAMMHARMLNLEDRIRQRATKDACPTCGGDVQRMADGRLIRHFDLRTNRWCAELTAQGRR